MLLNRVTINQLTRRFRIQSKRSSMTVKSRKYLLQPDMMLSTARKTLAHSFLVRRWNCHYVRPCQMKLLQNIGQEYQQIGRIYRTCTWSYRKLDWQVRQFEFPKMTVFSNVVNRSIHFSLSRNHNDGGLRGCNRAIRIGKFPFLLFGYWFGVISGKCGESVPRSSFWCSDVANEEPCFGESPVNVRINSFIRDSNTNNVLAEYVRKKT